jgi:hypothetical protein
MLRSPITMSRAATQRRSSRAMSRRRTVVASVFTM